MATLYETSSRARRIVLIILVVVFTLLALDTTLKYISRDNVVVPDRQNRFYMNVERTFGNLPAPEIPSLNYGSSASFILDGVHSEFPDIAYLYSVRRPRQNFSDINNAEESMQLLGYPTDESSLVSVDGSDTLVETKKDDGTKTLQYDEQQQTWKVTTQYTRDTATQNAAVSETDITEYYNTFQNQYEELWFDGLSVTNGRYLGFSDPIIEGEFATISGTDQLVKPSLLGTGTVPKFAYLNAFRQIRMTDLLPREEQPEPFENEVIPQEFDAKVYSNDPRFGQIEMVVSGSFNNLESDVFEIDFNNYEYGDTGAYLILTPDEAWDNVQNGGGSLAWLFPENTNYFRSPEESTVVTSFTADADQTELAYWQRDFWQEVEVGEAATYSGSDAIDLVFPIYVFRGIATLESGALAEFVFYVDAVKRAT